METEEALSLLKALLAHSTEPRFEYRHKCEAGDVVIWDTQCLPHKANGDYPSRRARRGKIAHVLFRCGHRPGHAAFIVPLVVGERDKRSV